MIWRRLRLIVWLTLLKWVSVAMAGVMFTNWVYYPPVTALLGVQGAAGLTLDDRGLVIEFGPQTSFLNFTGPGARSLFRVPSIFRVISMPSPPGATSVASMQIQIPCYVVMIGFVLLAVWLHDFASRRLLLLRCPACAALPVERMPERCPQCTSRRATGSERVLRVPRRHFSWIIAVSVCSFVFVVTAWAIASAIESLCLQLTGSSNIPVLQDWEAAGVTLTLAICLVAAYLATRMAFLRLRWRYRLELPMQCSHCGYNLTGNVSGVCPECGTAVADDAVRRRAPAVP